MKKLLCILLSVLMVFVMVSCAETEQEQNQAQQDNGEKNDGQNKTNEKEPEKGEIITDTNAGYEIEFLNGKYYVVFEDEKYKNNVNVSQEEPYLTFSSVAEMKDKLLSGKLTEDEIKTRSTFSKNDAGKIEVPDLGKVYVPIVPENVTCFESVTIGSGGTGYSVGLASDDCYISLFEVQSKERYEEHLKRMKDQLHNNKLVTITETIQTDDRDATVYWYTTWAGELKAIEYTITAEEGTIFVTETYCLRMNHDLLEVSDTVPNDIQLYGDFGDRYFYCSIYELTERPTVEWLSSFGLVEAK